MITKEELIKLGFQLLGIEDNDPFYRLTFSPPFNFGIINLSGELSEGGFCLWGNFKHYSDIEELKNVIDVIGSEIRR